MRNIKWAAIVLGVLMIGNVDLRADEPAKTGTAEVPGIVVESQNAAAASATEADAAAASDATTKPVTRAEIDGINSQLAILNDQLNRTLTLNTASTNRALQFSGTLQTRYVYLDTSNKNGSSSSKPFASRNSNGFSIPVASLALSGSLRKDYADGRNLDYVAGFQAASGSSWNLQATDAYLKYNFLPTLDNEKPLLYIQVGQQKRPFGVEPLATEDKQPAINLATFAGGSGYSLSTRDIGVQLKGDLFPAVDTGYSYRVPLIEYSVGYFNGSLQDATDTNRAKDFVGRINFNAPVDYNSDFRGLTAGVSYLYGKGDYSYKNSGGTATTFDYGRADKIRWGYDISYVASPVGFTAEYAAGRDARVTNTGNISETVARNSIRTINSQGYTLTFFYQWGEQFLKSVRSQARADDWWPTTYQPFIRYDRWDPDTAIAKNETSIWTLGFNVFFAQTTKFQINYNISQNRDRTNADVIAAGSGALRKHELDLQFQYGF
ncbi:MAG TPA: porin [Chlorobaculum sp.]|nr:porin [Chlorobaculum sp.]